MTEQRICVNPLHCPCNSSVRVELFQRIGVTFLPSWRAKVPPNAHPPTPTSTPLPIIDLFVVSPPRPSHGVGITSPSDNPELPLLPRRGPSLFLCPTPYLQPWR